MRGTMCGAKLQRGASSGSESARQHSKSAERIASLFIKPEAGLEPAAHGLQNRCSAN
jgi:hypothetical protein